MVCMWPHEMLSFVFNMTNENKYYFYHNIIELKTLSTSTFVNLNFEPLDTKTNPNVKTNRLICIQ